MAAPAETIRVAPPPQEEYAHSHSRLRAMGALALNQEIILEEAAETQQSFMNFRSGVQEMMRTDPEFRGILDIEGKRKLQVIDGQARDVDGTAMVDLVEEGRQISEAMAENNSVFQSQATRDRGDEKTAETADELKPGQSYIATSMAPKKALKEHPEIYRDYFGYRENLVYVQWYSKETDDNLWAGYCSIEVNDEQAFAEVLAEEGIIIPPGASPDTWIQYGLKTEFTPEQAEEYVSNIRSKYYARVGMVEERVSVSNYVEDNSNTIKTLFDAFYPGLAKAIYSKENNETMQGLASALLQTDLSRMKAEIRTQLIQVANSSSFNDGLGKTMESVIRYAVVEELRKGLKDLINGNQSDHSRSPSTFYVSTDARNLIPGMQPSDINQRMAGNVQSGIRAGRSYGGCAGQVELNKNMESNSPGNWLEGSKQEPHGGKSCRSIKHGVSTTCPHCRKSVKTIVPVAGGKVFCSNARCREAAPRLLLEKINPSKQKAA